ncbi:nuclear transport factor 2 family protein [Aeromicrobium sp. Leaf350]|uniref:nuclear transport factor 2 family protein n=1 Tax=Aeromicrobium sp. Leaf350 TaxID=2876565 RepID=UPI001E57AD36|nr:nuclear transport factor 2 family protein [Aeromicrobium sp. Leaf350]
MSGDVLAVHRSFYEAIEAGDVDLMAALWIDRPDTSCAHPGTTPVRGTSGILRSWTMLMAQAGYLQFFLTDVQAAYTSDGAVAIVTCTENILSGHGLESPDSFAGGKVTSTSILVLRQGRWQFHTRHASPIIDFDAEPTEEE